MSLSLNKGQIVTVIGPNGAGKTTLLAATIGLLPSRGRLMFDGEDLFKLDVEARVEHGFCLVPETRELFGELTRLRQSRARRLSATLATAPSSTARWTRPMAAFRGLPNAACSAPTRSRAANARCSRSAGR